MRTLKETNTAVAGRSNFAVTGGLLSPADIQKANLRLVVLYTTPKATREALGIAAALGHGLGMKLSLLDIQVVPYSCGMDRPPVEPAFSKRRLEGLAQECDAPMLAEVVYTRDRDEALAKRLCPGSLILISARGFWNRLFNRSLVRKLTRLGHDVVLVR